MSAIGNENKNAAPSATEGQGAAIRLKDLILLGLPASGVYLVHADTDVGFVPAADLPWLSGRGKKQFAPLLDAVVEGVGPGAYGMELKLCGVEPRVLANYDQCLADEAGGRVTGMFLPDRHSGAVEALEHPPGQSVCPEEAEARRIFSAFRIKEGGQERLLRVDGEKEFLDAAVILRRYLRGEAPGNPSCLADCYSPSHSISEEEFNAMVDLRFQNTGKVAGAFDIDIDKGEFSALHIMDGWQTFSVKHVSTAAYRAMWHKHMRESDRWELFLDALDGKEFSQQPAQDAGLQLGV